MIVYVDLARDAPWQDAHLKVCLLAYYRKFFKLLAYIRRSSIIDLELLNPNANYTKEITNMAPFI